MLLINVEGKAV